MIKRILLLFLVFLFIFSVSAQKSSIDLGKDYFESGNYSLAQSIFLDQLSCDTYKNKDELLYLIGSCSRELSNSDSKYWYSLLIKEYIYSPYYQIAKKYLAFVHFSDKDYLGAEMLLSEISDESLKNDEFYFKLAYSFFINGNYDEAKYNFSKTKNKKGKYRSLSLYYYAHISYTQELYKTSLLNFQLLKDDKTFANIVPYYITQIYYSQNNYKDLIDYAVPILDHVVPSRKEEINRFIAESYFQISDFHNAEIYLKNYISLSEDIQMIDYFQLGQINVFLEDYEEAVIYLEKIHDVPDSLMQYSSYYLGKSYIKVNKKSFALNAFKKASDLDFDISIKEESLYNYFKLSYELDLPYTNLNDIMLQMDTLNLIKYKPELKRLMINMFQSTNQYQEAFDFLKNEHLPDEQEKQTLQRLSYYIGVQHYNNGNYTNALSMFEYSRKYPENQEIDVMSIYWIADCYYNLSNYNNSIDYYKQFLKSPSNSLFDKIGIARYNLAYSYFQSDQYTLSVKYFRKAIGSDLDKLRLNDAYLRLADSYYMLNNFIKARTNYVNGAKISLIDQDYTLYQQSKCSGFLSDYDSQEKVLLVIEESFKSSPYITRSLLDLANLYKNKRNYKEALSYYDKTLDKTKEQEIESFAILSKGLIYFNQGNFKKSIELMKNIILNYPKSSSFSQSKIAIKDAYVQLGNIDEYIDFINSIPEINLTNAYKDSITFEVAYNNYKQNKYNQSILDLNKYISNFGNDAIFINESYFYLAESYWNIKDTTNGISMYKKVIEFSNIDYLETALIRLSRYFYGIKNYNSSNYYYQQLDTIGSNNNLRRESIIRLMFGFEHLDTDRAIDYAERVLLLKKNDNRLVARAKIIIARSDFNNGNYIRSSSLCDEIVDLTTNSDGSEAMYMKVYFTYLQEDYDKTEELIFLMADKYSSSHWIAKAFILLADVYQKTDNYYQAKATLESIIENHHEIEVVNEARIKWEKLVEQEESKEFNSKKTDAIIEIGDDILEYEINYEELEIDSDEE